MRLRHSLQLLVASLSLGSLLLLGCSQNRQFGEEDQSHLQPDSQLLSRPVSSLSALQ
ncbi:hypothetical protein H6G20_18680 [Desertifilum sp. FACHB-1129]|uniref:Uncharacterized protein n=1 Tax=Desertifilum tharense IPPAS B-1220 TaxID=1781255 RepID=A0ACD5GW73_9CYAN|nr:MULTISPECIES: hypothetical protein [Desertifilum]MBD2313697.1 hypothetical protein [Desertifilum sp. FACHB-1129]MBD2324991.1 hypothetical protein [Desertifilum sp. FACHB-866]MBD2335130.1 hypothetical protein [Desertifilum sp. FACHB-868]MDA0213365.1 hypothetical protein [Cyanobacteria bacterium FC1]